MSSDNLDNVVLLRPKPDPQPKSFKGSLPRGPEELEPWLDDCLRALGFIVGPPRSLHRLVRAHRLRLRLVAALGLSLEATKLLSEHIELAFMGKLLERDDFGDACFAIDVVYGCVADALGLDPDTGIASDDPEFIDAIGDIEATFLLERTPDEAFAELRRSLEASRIKSPPALAQAVGNAILTVSINGAFTTEMVAAEFMRVNAGRGWTARKVEDSHYLFEDDEGGKISTKSWGPIRARAEKIAKNRPRGS